MYTIKTDTHMHTLCSGHAYSTIEENVRAGKEQGMEAIGITDHFSRLFVPDTNFQYYGHFGNYKAVPKEWYGVRIFAGAEVDITDLDGNLFGNDMVLPFSFAPGRKPTYLEWLGRSVEYFIASVHDRQFAEGASLAETTRMYCRVLENPKVLIIGHIGRAGVPFDLDEVLLAAKQLDKYIEINEGSMIYPEHITGLCQKIAERCAELGVKISLGSDAHSAWYVGRFGQALAMLERIHFPEELIATRSRELLEERVKAL